MVGYGPKVDNFLCVCACRDGEEKVGELGAERRAELLKQAESKYD